MENLEILHMKFKDKVKKMLDAQQAYFKSNHDKQKLMIAKSLEKQVRDFIDPPPPKVEAQQSLFDWLGQ